MSSVGIFVKEAGSSGIKRLNFPLRRLLVKLLVIDIRLFNVSLECFRWTVVRDFMERTELLRDDRMLEGRERCFRIPVTSYSDTPERSFDFLVNRISAVDVAPCSRDEARLPIGSGGGAV
jgi:hypothetical protein